jgi:hypothetical protein
MVRHHAAFGGSVPAIFRSNHGCPERDPSHQFPKRNPAETGEEPAGCSVLLAGLGVGSICQVGSTTQDRSKRSENFQRKYAASASSTLTFTPQADELLRVDVPRDDIDARDPALIAREPLPPSLPRRTILRLGQQAR